MRYLLRTSLFAVLSLNFISLAVGDEIDEALSELTELEVRESLEWQRTRAPQFDYLSLLLEESRGALNSAIEIEVESARHFGRGFIGSNWIQVPHPSGEVFDVPQPTRKEIEDRENHRRASGELKKISKEIILWVAEQQNVQLSERASIQRIIGLAGLINSKYFAKGESELERLSIVSSENPRLMMEWTLNLFYLAEHYSLQSSQSEGLKGALEALASQVLLNIGVGIRDQLKLKLDLKGGLDTNGAEYTDRILGVKGERDARGGIDLFIAIRAVADSASLQSLGKLACVSFL